MKLMKKYILRKVGVKISNLNQYLSKNHISAKKPGHGQIQKECNSTLSRDKIGCAVVRQQDNRQSVSIRG
jgi:hypothetical protein